MARSARAMRVAPPVRGYNAPAVLGFLMRTARELYTLASLSLIMGAFLTVLTGSDLDLSQGSSLLAGVFATVYGIAAISLASRPQRTWRLAKSIPIIWVLIGLALASTAWSSAPAISLQRALALAGTTAFAVWLASTYTLEMLVRRIAVAGAFALASSAVFVVAFPDIGVSTGATEGAWKGVFAHKNALGRIATLVGITSLYLALSRSRQQWLWWCMTAAAAIMGLGANSLTSLIIAVIAVLAVPVGGLAARHSQARALMVLVIFGLAAGSITLASDVLPSITAALGRDTTLTGRTELWGLVFSSAEERAWFGHGFAAFWLGWTGPSQSIWSQLRWQPPHAHNGFLDVLLNLGVVGLAVFGGALLRALHSATRLALRPGYAINRWAWAFLLLFTGLNMAESIAMSPHSIFWAGLVAVLVYGNEPSPAAQSGRS